MRLRQTGDLPARDAQVIEKTGNTSSQASDAAFGISNPTRPSAA